MTSYFLITIECILFVLIIVSAVLSYINYWGKENAGSVVNTVAEAQIQTTTRVNSDNNTEESISAEELMVVNQTVLQYRVQESQTNRPVLIQHLRLRLVEWK